MSELLLGRILKLVWSSDIPTEHTGEMQFAERKIEEQGQKGLKLS